MAGDIVGAILVFAGAAGLMYWAHRRGFNRSLGHIAIASLLCIAGIGGTISAFQAAPTTSASSTPTTTTTVSSTTTTQPVPVVVYEVTGTVPAVDITISNAQGGTEQYANVALPSERAYFDFPGLFLYISAQNSSGVSGTVTVNIYVKGRLVKTSTSSGAYVIASASGYK